MDFLINNTLHRLDYETGKIYELSIGFERGEITHLNVSKVIPRKGIWHQLEFKENK